MSLLDDLKKEANSIRNREAVNTHALKTNVVAIDQGLRKIFDYFNELFKQLNIIKPLCETSYHLHGVGALENLMQIDYRIEYRTSRRIDSEQFESLDITFKRTKPGQITVRRDAEQIEKFRDLLWQSNLRYVSEPFHNKRRLAIYEIFKIDQEVICGAAIAGEFDNGLINFRLKNVEDFGPTGYTLKPESLTEQALEEFAMLLIGKKSGFKKFNYHPDFDPVSTGPFARAAEIKIPAYIIDSTPPPEEKKAGLLTQIKSLLKKPES